MCFVLKNIQKDLVCVIPFVYLYSTIKNKNKPLIFYKMKTYCIFLQMSTGYISGTIPPQFSEDHKQPIEGCGNDSVMLLDNRNSVSTMFDKCLTELKNRKQFIGFKIVRCASLLDKYHLVSNYIYPNTIK